MITMDEGEWLVPFAGRNHSGAYDQNFLWRHKQLYVMDNHRAALWCWMQHLKPDERHSIFHIDRHADMRDVDMDAWLPAVPSTWDLSIDKYLKIEYHNKGHDQILPVFAWDNYLSIHLAANGPFVKQVRFATHCDRNLKTDVRVWQTRIWDIPDNFDFWVSDTEAPWVMNVDLDYFFCTLNESAEQMVTDHYVEQLFAAIRAGLEDGSIRVVTTCLTPTKIFTGGWGPTERLAQMALRALGIEFELPGPS